MTLMDYAPAAQEVPQALAGVALLILATIVLAVSIGSKLNRAFALFLVLFGLFVFWGAMDDTPALSNLAWGLWPYFGLACPFALTYLGVRLREAQGGRPVPRWLGWGLLAAALLAEAIYVYDHQLFASGRFGASRREVLFPLSFAGLGLVASALVGRTLANQADRARGTSRSGLVVAAAGFLVLVAFDALVSIVRLAGGAWGGVPFSPTTPSSLATGVLQGFALAVAIAAVPRLHRLGRPWGLRAVSVIAAAAASALLVGALTSVSALPWLFHAADGTWSLIAAFMLSYAVLKGQVVHLDAKFRFAISKSTLAAAFIAVFFVASEAAQQFFGQRFESGYLGILAAGALVFAISPLSRLADRLAEKAVPAAGPMPPAPAASAERDYRATVALALREGGMSQAEERSLLRVAERLGIPASRALDIHEELEKEGRP